MTLAASRPELVWGKMAVTFLFMAVSLAICIVSFAIAVQFLPLAEIGMTASLTPLVCVGIYLVMLPFSALGAGVMTIVASYTKSFREAQTYTSIAMVAPPLPIILVVLNPVQPSLPLMLVPSLSQHLLVTELVKGGGFRPFASRGIGRRDDGDRGRLRARDRAALPQRGDPGLTVPTREECCRASESFHLEPGFLLDTLLRRRVGLMELDGTYICLSWKVVPGLPTRVRWQSP